MSNPRTSSSRMSRRTPARTGRSRTKRCCPWPSVATARCGPPHRAGYIVAERRADRRASARTPARLPAPGCSIRAGQHANDLPAAHRGQHRRLGEISGSGPMPTSRYCDQRPSLPGSSFAVGRRRARHHRRQVDCRAEPSRISAARDASPRAHSSTTRSSRLFTKVTRRPG